MNRTLVALCSVLLPLCGCSVFQSSGSGYDYRINLNEIDGDELSVELAFRGNLPNTGDFCLPRIVPGIYDALNYGKFMSDLRAVDHKGQALEVNRTDINCWKIIGANSIASINYKVHDGWKSFDFQGIRPYRSSESHFESSVVILNANAVFRYFSQNEHLPFRITVQKPEDF